ncbi:hypothetical protein H6P81_000948 [Aristolochia fimbriata]|uniref:Uncharacterized protein n=1 Tax=Aristolochia fimbriata TaxID=158543 RepID=A0AAV7F5I8_ARIFI|nr:hypothetical protein H6P81_000948 [Aristolochia fimbriata]
MMMRMNEGKRGLWMQVGFEEDRKRTGGSTASNSPPSLMGGPACPRYRRTFTTQSGGKYINGPASFAFPPFSTCNSKDLVPFPLFLVLQWEGWLKTKEMMRGGEDYRWGEAELIVRVTNLCGGRSMYPEQVLSHPLYQRLARLTDSVCHQILRMREPKVQSWSRGTDGKSELAGESIDHQMQEIVEVVLQSSKGLDRDVKQTFLTVARGFYYSVHCPSDVFDNHIASVLFDRVD